MNNPLLFATIFFVTSTIYLVLSYYILSVDFHSLKNRLVFLIGLLLGIWAFGYAISTTAPTEQDALLWRRFASIGATFVFAALLHFVLVLTKRYRSALLILALYSIAFLNATLFVFPASVAERNYQMVEQSHGWVCIWPPTIANTFYTIYYLTYTMISVLFLVNWYLRMRDRRIRKIVTILLGSLIFSTVFGTMTDLLMASYVVNAPPELGIVYTLLPFSVVARLSQVFGFLKPVEPAVEQETLLDEHARRDLFRYIGVIILSVSMIHFYLEYFIAHRPLLNLYVLLVILLTIGFSTGFIDDLLKKQKHQENALVFLTLLLIVTVNVFYAFQAGVTVWGFSLFVLMFFIPLRSSKLLWFTVGVMFLIELMSSIYMPRVTVYLNQADHVVRLGLLLMSLGMALFISKLYRKRIAEHHQQLHFQTHITDLTQKLASSNINTPEKALRDALEIVARYFRADCIAMNNVTETRHIQFYSSSWNALSAQQEVQIEELLNYPKLRRWLNTHGEIVFLSREELEDWMPPLSDTMAEHPMQQIMLVPLYSGSATLGFICLGLPHQVEGTLDAIDAKFISIASTNIINYLFRIEREKEIHYLAYYDSLTGIPGRKLFNESLRKALDDHRGTAKKLAVLFLDLDSFKNINDTAGHDAGDELLRQITQKLSDAKRPGDIISRFGGDEFVILMQDFEDLDDLTQQGEAFLKVLREPMQLEGAEFYISFSGGISQFPQDGNDALSLINHADMAMYHAKKQGKNRIAFFEPHMKTEIQSKVELINSLHHAVGRNELEVYYQPQYDLKDLRIIGCEALVRWNHPKLGLIMPGTFISLAEQAGLIDAIGQWVLRQSATQAKLFRQSGFPIRIAVNVSVEQLKNQEFVHILQSIKEELGGHQDLVLEITETIAIRQNPYVLKTLAQVRELGFSIAIDDFGISHSSYERLNEISFEKLKIDMSFVAGIGQEKGERILLNMIELGKTLQVKILAEGVETAEQLEFLRAHGCDEGQGFYLAKPMPIKAFKAVLRRTP